MNINNIKEILEQIDDVQIRFFINIFNKKNISQEEKNKVLKDLLQILKYSKSNIEKNRIESFITKIENIREIEKLEREEELKNLDINL